MKVLIADDEPDVRMGLKEIIDWPSLGFTVGGEAANGSECLEKILALNPELVLLDIRMPKMHGLECAKVAREKGWNGKIIILSGYSDFQYAQDAIRCGVETYLLKPIDEVELAEAVQSIHQKIERERSQSQRMSFAMEKARTMMLADILTGKSRSAQPSHLNELGLNADSYLVVISDRKKSAADKENSGDEVAKFLRTHSVEHVSLQGMNTYLIKGEKSIRKFEGIVSNNPDETLFFAVGRVVATASDIPKSYQDALTVYARRFFCPENQYAVHVSDLPASPNPYNISDTSTQECVEKFYLCVQSGNFERICTELDSMQGGLAAMEVQPNDIMNYLINIFIQVKNAVLKDYQQKGISLQNDVQIISSISGKTRLYEIIAYIKIEFQRIINSISVFQSDHIASRVRQYIEKNYSRNLRLEQLAQLFGYNSAYLGKLFKSSAGESFNSYLDRVRITKAKEFLQQKDLKVYEISKMVGYENIDYFYIKFHKYMGQSPSEYRKTLCDNHTLNE